MKTVVLTGCNRGIGKGLMEYFASQGWHVIAIVRKASEEFQQELTRLSEMYQAPLTPVFADLSDKESLTTAVTKVSEMDCAIDVLINNAGINISRPVFYLDYEDVERSFKVNYYAPFFLSKEIGRLMIGQQSGVILNITSVAGLTAQPGGAAYDASKAALNMFTKSLALELAPFGVRVNAVACSVVETDMYKDLKPEVQKKILKRVALKRPSTIKEVADVIDFLASEKASYMTGQIVQVDGGYTL